MAGGRCSISQHTEEAGVVYQVALVGLYPADPRTPRGYDTAAILHAVDGVGLMKRAALCSCGAGDRRHRREGVLHSPERTRPHQVVECVSART